MKSRKARSPAVLAANTLTARWCSHMGAEDYVLSGAGLWPLLALLAAAADEPAGAELAAALGQPTDTAQQDALAIIDLLRGGRSANAALGIWTATTFSWIKIGPRRCPAGWWKLSPIRRALDQWAAEQTGGLIDEFPLTITEATALVLASALTGAGALAHSVRGSPRTGRELGRRSGPRRPTVAEPHHLGSGDRGGPR